MADVFISYAREDRAKATVVAEALESRGLSVWWDRELLPHEGFRKAIEGQLASAGAVLVLWSKYSIHSDFVLDEAATAADQNKIIQAWIDEAQAPLGFRQRQIANLRGRITADNQELLSVVNSVRQLAGRTPEVAAEKQVGTLVRLSIALVLTIGAAFFGAWIGTAPDPVPAVSASVSTIKNDCEEVQLHSPFQLVAGSAEDSAEQIALCDSLASHNLDTSRPHGVPGRTFPQVMDNAKAAVAACRQAIKSRPKKRGTLARMYFNLARALLADQQAWHIDHYRIAAELGSRRSQMSMGLMFVEGSGVEQSFTKARCYFEMAEANGDATAKEVLGRFAELGIGEPRNNAKAESIMFQAAELGYSRANYNYATLLLEKGGDANKSKAYQHLQTAILNGDEKAPYALTQLGWMYEKGKGVEADIAKARNFYRRALQQEHRVAAIALAKLDAVGEGDVVKLDKAAELLNRGLKWRSNPLERDAPWIYRDNKDFDALVLDAIVRIRDAAATAGDEGLAQLVRDLNEQHRSLRMPPHFQYNCNDPIEITSVELCLGYKPPTQ